MTKEELSELHNRLWNLRHAILQFLQEPNKNIERMKLEGHSIKNLIEDIVVTEYKEDENGTDR
jgi:hypothetical protein